MKLHNLKILSVWHCGRYNYICIIIFRYSQFTILLRGDHGLYYNVTADHICVFDNIIYMFAMYLRIKTNWPTFVYQ